MSREVNRPKTLRGRDICTILAVVIVGLGMINIVLSQNTNAAGVIAVGTVLAAVGLLVIGFGGGWLVDRFTRRHPWIARNHFSTVVFLLAPPLLVLLGVMLWRQRDTIVDDARDSAGIVMTKLERVVMGDVD